MVCMPTGSFHLALHVQMRVKNHSQVFYREDVNISSRITRGIGSGLDILERAEDAICISVLLALSCSLFLIIHEFVDFTQ